MPRPLVFVLVDGLSRRGALAMPGLAALVARGEAFRWSVEVAEPTWSRPNYATLVSGLSPARHGITRNEQRQPLDGETLFDTLRQHGLRTAVAGYHWWNELVGPRVDGAWYYVADDTPDVVVLDQAERLFADIHPHFLLVHLMSVDYAGHREGGYSLAYQEAAQRLDGHLFPFVSAWQERYPHGAVIIGADHGMAERGHGGMSADERVVYYFAVMKPMPGRWPGSQEGVRAFLEALILDC
ncbi:MAG: alkaline phosphatase family protein [Firmicutes bacterium]|nr:alkaline phosphatase family protein [Bacillota bacterium]